jgi:hypothetical protein
MRVSSFLAIASSALAKTSLLKSTPELALFSEKLNIRQLADGKVLAEFDFKTRVHQNWFEDQIKVKRRVTPL